MAHRAVRLAAIATTGLFASSCLFIARVSVDQSGTAAADPATAPSISFTGRFVVFGTTSALVPSDANGVSDIYRRDLVSGTTEIVSVDVNGVEADGASSDPSISDDGQRIAFRSHATNLVAGATHTADQIYVKDMATNEVTLVSRHTNGQAASGLSYSADISGDGTHVAFTSRAGNLGGGADWNFDEDVFVHDTSTSTTTRLTLGGSMEKSNHAAASVDGRHIAFSTQIALDPTDVNGRSDVYVYDNVGATYIRASVDSAGAGRSAGSDRASISADGRYVSFSTTGQFSTEDTNNGGDVYVRDMTLGTTTLVSIDLGGEAANQSYLGHLSADGATVAFLSAADDLVPDDTNAALDVFVHDLATRTTQRRNVDANGNETTGVLDQKMEISGNGGYVAFDSLAQDLAAGDMSPGLYDVFVSRSKVAEPEFASPGSGDRGTTMPVSLHGKGFVSGTTTITTSPGLTVLAATVVSATRIDLVVEIDPAAPLTALAIAVVELGGLGFGTGSIATCGGCFTPTAP